MTTPLAGRWTLGEPVRRDGLGEVFLATDLDGSAAWVRLLPPALVPTPGLGSRLGALPRVSARHLCRLADAGVVTVEGAPVAYAAYAVGEDAHDLATVLQRGPLSAQAAVRICADVCWGLTAAHAAGLVHGTLSARDVVVPEDLRGSRVFGTGLFSLVREVLGTAPPRSAPEVRAGEVPSVASDLWSVGALMQLCLGDDPDAVPEPLQEVLAQLLDPDPDRRPRSARIVATRLISMATGLRELTAPTGPARPARQPLPPQAPVPSPPAPPTRPAQPQGSPDLEETGPQTVITPAVEAELSGAAAESSPPPTSTTGPEPLAPPAPRRLSEPPELPRPAPGELAPIDRFDLDRFDDYDEDPRVRRILIAAALIALAAVVVVLIIVQNRKDDGPSTVARPAVVASPASVAAPDSATPGSSPSASAASNPQPIVTPPASTDPAVLAHLMRVAITGGDAGAGAQRQKIPDATDYNAFVRAMFASCDYYTPVGSPRIAHKIVRFDLPGGIEVVNDVTAYPVAAQSVVDGLRTSVSRCGALSLTEAGKVVGRFKVQRPAVPLPGLPATAVELEYLSLQPVDDPVRLVAFARAKTLDVVIVRGPTTAALLPPAQRVVHSALGRLSAVVTG